MHLLCKARYNSRAHIYSTEVIICTVTRHHLTIRGIRASQPLNINVNALPVDITNRSNKDISYSSQPSIYDMEGVYATTTSMVGAADLRFEIPSFTVPHSIIVHHYRQRLGGSNNLLAAK